MIINWIIESPLEDSILQKMQHAADMALLCERVRIPCFITVRLCSDESIAAVNSSFRNIPHSTDVLSFPTVTYPPGQTAQSCEERIRREYDDEMDACFLGDIVISVPHIQSQAEEYGHSVEREACYLLVHGICHLMGYDHMTEEEKGKMRFREEDILSSF